MAFQTGQLGSRSKNLVNSKLSQHACGEELISEHIVTVKPVSTVRKPFLLNTWQMAAIAETGISRRLLSIKQINYSLPVSSGRQTFWIIDSTYSIQDKNN